MLTRTNSHRRTLKLIPVSFLILICSAALSISAQMPSVPVPPPETETAGDFTLWYIALFVLSVGLAGAIYWSYSSKKAKKEVVPGGKKTTNVKNSWEIDSVDANRELAWLKKNHKIMGSKGIGSKNGAKSPVQQPLLKKSPLNSRASQLSSPQSAKLDLNALLPIFSVTKLDLSRPFEQLSLSSDAALISAIEQTQDEFEEDENVRELAVRILNAFKTRNSIEALSQVALYDLSSALRSKAVTILSDFDHESVFSSILLACADPTREVRAAAARGLTRLSCDRADAWTRIIETEEEGRMVQAARAAIEGDMVERTFSRLVHSDRKFAYEGFTLLALLIKANETKLIFKSLVSHEDINVRRAILHVVKVTRNHKALKELYSLLERGALTLELQEEADKVIEEIGFVTA